MIVAVTVAGPSGGERTTFVPEMPFSGRLTIGGRDADVPLGTGADVEAELKAQGDAPPLLRPIRGEVLVDGRTVTKPRELADGMRLSIAGRSFTVRANGGFLIEEHIEGRAAEPEHAPAGLEVFNLPAQFLVHDSPLKALREVRFSLHLDGVGLFRGSEASAAEALWDGTAPAAALDRHRGSLDRGLSVLHQEEGRSIVLVSVLGPEGRQAVLAGWARRPLSLGYLANLYRAWPDIASSLLVEKACRRIAGRAADEWLSAFSLVGSGLMHVFNNSLGSVQGYAQLLKDDPKYIDKLQSAVDSAMTANMELLEILRGVSGAPRERGRQCFPSTLASSLYRIFLAEAHRRRVALELEVEDGGPIIAPRGGMQRLIFLLFFHLLENTPEGRKAVLDLRSVGGRPALTALPALEETEGAACVRSLRPAEGSDARGAALETPLYVRQLETAVEACGGTLEQLHYRGAPVLRVLLPLSSESPSGTEDRVLVLDDNADCLRLAEFALRPALVDAATTTEQALDLLTSHSYSAVLLELNLASSPEDRPLYDLVARDFPDTRIVLTTSLLLGDREKECYPHAAAILEKPFTMDDLRKALLVEEE